MNDENPYASPSGSPTDPSSAAANEVVLPLTETVVFDAALLSKYEQRMAGCLRPVLRTAAAIVGLACGAVATLLLTWNEFAYDPQVMLVSAIFGIPSLALVVWAIYQPQISTWLLSRNLRKHGRETEQVRYTVSTEGVTVKSEIEVREIPWASFAARVETPDFVILYLQDGRQQLFPIAQLSAEFLDVLRSESD